MSPTVGALVFSVKESFMVYCTGTSQSLPRLSSDHPQDVIHAYNDIPSGICIEYSVMRANGEQGGMHSRLQLPH